MEGRQDLIKEEIDIGLADLRQKLYGRLKEKGCHSWKSRHEVLGIITEEYHELVEAVKKHLTLPAKDGYIRSDSNMEKELLDLAVAAILGYINVKNKKTDW